MKAQRLSWAQVEPALPPANCCDCIDVLDLAEGQVREFFLHPECSLVNLDAVVALPKAGTMMCKPGEDAVIGRELLKRSIPTARWG